MGTNKNCTTWLYLVEVRVADAARLDLKLDLVILEGDWRVVKVFDGAFLLIGGKRFEFLEFEKETKCQGKTKRVV